MLDPKRTYQELFNEWLESHSTEYRLGAEFRSRRRFSETAIFNAYWGVPNSYPIKLFDNTKGWNTAYAEQVTLEQVLSMTIEQIQAGWNVGPATIKVLGQFLRDNNLRLADGWDGSEQVAA